MKKDKPEVVTRYEAFLKMDAVIQTLIPHDPPGFKVRSLSDMEILGYAGALDGHLEAVQREWVRRQMSKEEE